MVPNPTLMFRSGASTWAREVFAKEPIEMTVSATLGKEGMGIAFPLPRTARGFPSTDSDRRGKQP